jgi:hypothetical protein
MARRRPSTAPRSRIARRAHPCGPPRPRGEDGFDVARGAPGVRRAPRVNTNHDATIRRAESEGNTVLVAAAGRTHPLGRKLSIATARSVSGDVDEKTGDVRSPATFRSPARCARTSVKAGGNLAVRASRDGPLCRPTGTSSMEGGIRARAGERSGRARKSGSASPRTRDCSPARTSSTQLLLSVRRQDNARLVMNGNPGVLLGGSVHASQGIEYSSSAPRRRSARRLVRAELPRQRPDRGMREGDRKIKETVAAIDAR